MMEMFFYKYKTLQELKDDQKKQINRDIQDKTIIQFESNRDISKFDPEEIVHKLFSDVREDATAVIVKRITERYDGCENADDIKGRIGEAILELKEKEEESDPWIAYIKQICDNRFEWTVIQIVVDEKEPQVYCFCSWSI